MKSSESLYALLAVYIPISALAGFLPLVVLAAERLHGSPYRFLLPLWFAAAFISALAASLYSALIYKSKADHWAANVRGAALIMIITYGLSSLMQVHFSPSLYNVPAALCALAVWFPVLFIKKIFNGQKVIEANTRLYEGEKLRLAMFEDAGLISDVDVGMQIIIGHYRFYFLLSLPLLLCCKVFGISPGGVRTALLFALFIFWVFIITFLELLRRENSCAAEGLVLSNRPRILSVAILVILIAAAAGLALSSDKSLLSPALIAALINAFYTFLGKIFRPAEAASSLAEQPQLQPDTENLYPQFLAMLGESKTWPFWNWLKYGIMAAAAILFVWFILHPLLGRSRLLSKAPSLPGRIYLFLRIWLKALVRGLILFFKSLRQGSGGNNSLSFMVPGVFETVIPAGYSPAKRRELRRSISLFARLIRWGAEILKIPWKPSHAPAEYCSLLAPAAQEGTLIVRAGELFEKALYSPRPLLRKEREEFKRLIKTITKYTDNRETHE